MDSSINDNTYPPPPSHTPVPPPDSSPVTSPPKHGFKSWPMPAEPDASMVDSLADLFLGDGTLAPGMPADGSPKLRLAGREEAEANFASFETKPAAEAQCAEQNRRNTQTNARAQARPSTRTRSRLEAIVLGHLPVLAPAWAMQYAGYRARELGEPVVLARLSGGMATIEVVGETNPDTGTTASTSTTLAAAVRSAAVRSRVWIIRVDELDEPALAEASGLDAITVLTGSDEPAVVACYRTLKGLAHDTAAAQGDDEAPPTLGVAIMGATDQHAGVVEQKLRQICRTFLGRAELPTARLSRMTPVSSMTLYRGSCQEPAPVFIASIRAAAQSATVEGSRAASTVPASKAAVPLAETMDSVMQTVFSDEDWDLNKASTHAQDQAEHDSAIDYSGHDMGNDTWSMEDWSDEEPLAPLPTKLIGGLEPLEFICPYAPSVEMAVDAQGRLHLIGLDGGDRHPVGDLMAARAWAHAHAKLLTSADKRISDPTHARMHLMTDRPELARGLLDTEVRVHLLAHASTASRGWVARALNGA